MAAVFEKTFFQNLQGNLIIRYCPEIVFSKDNLSNEITVKLYNGESEYSGGGTVSATVIRADGRTVPLTGTLTGNVVSLALIESCMEVPGQIQIFIRLTSGNVKTTVFAGVFTAVRTETDAVIDPGTIIPSVTDLINQIDAAIDSIPADYSTLLGSVASTYSASKTYAVGDYVWYDGALYRCTTAISTAESWTAAHWSSAVLGEDISVLKSAISANVQVDSPWIYDIYGSSSDNILDSEHYVNGYKISPTPPYIVREDGCAISRFIYVQDLQGQQITATYTKSGAAFLFLSDATLDNTANIIEYNLTNSSRTLTVPAIAKYALVSARFKSSSRTYDYLSGMKISRTASATTDEFSPVYIGNKYVPNINKVIQEQNIIVGSSTKNILDTSKYVVGYRGTDVSPYFKTDKPSAVMSYPIYVKGKGTVTIRSKNISSSLRFVVFTSTNIMLADYVVGTNYMPVNATGDYIDKTIGIPSTAVYMYYTLNAGSSGDDWSYDTIAYGTDGTNDAYDGSVLDGVVIPSTGKVLTTASGSSVSDSTKEFEKSDTLKKFVPLTVGGSNSQIIGSRYSRANFLFFSDSHVDLPRDAYVYSIENVEDAISIANGAHFDLDAVIHAGDVVTGSGVATQANWINSMKPFFDNLKKSEKPAIFAIGNHDTNDWGNTPANAMDDTAWGTAWLDYAEETYGIVRQTKQNGHKSTWHYLDIPSKKIRIISVDVQDTDKSVTDGNGKVLYSGQKAWYVSNEQMNWIAGTALNFDNKDEKDWGVIMVMHQSMSYLNTWYATSAVSPAYESSIQKLLMLCKAFNTQGAYTENYTFATDSFYNLSVNADFTRYASETNKPYMICWLCGHEHVDKEATVEGINIIWTLNGSATSDSGDARVARIPKTSTQNAFNLISVDTTERKIRVVRYGAGKNCFGVEPYTFMETGLSF